MERDLGYLADVLKASRQIRKFVGEKTFEEFSQDNLTQSAVLHQFAIVGEAAGRVSTPFVVDHPELPWRKMVGMRNRVIHGYDDIDLEVVWETICVSIPSLISLIEPLLPQEED